MDSSESVSWEPERLASLPRPVQRYFRAVFPDGSPFFQRARFVQEGALRTSVKSRRWMPFIAEQNVSIDAPGFIWRARVHAAPLVSIQVLDSYQRGVGAGEVRLFSALPVARETGRLELSSGALHRYLAEAVWFPTALLPRTGLEWTAIDDSKACATLSDHGVTVTLEFRFAPSGEVSSIFTPTRWGRFADGYRQVPWEGHFTDYFEQDGMRIPRYGEVGWYAGNELQLVWKGTLRSARFERSQ